MTPATIGWSLEPARPVAGQPFDLVIRWSDAEAGFGQRSGSCMPSLSPMIDGAAPKVINLCMDSFPGRCDAYGTWPLPPAHPGSGEDRITNTLPAGSYTFDYSVTLSSDPPGSGSCRPDPYRDTAFVKDSFTVLPGP